MRAYLWSYRVKSESAEAFARAYSPAGEWSALFSRSPDYQGTTLLRDPCDDCRFMTIDRFLTAEGRKAFMDEWRTAYDALDRRWRDATLEEVFIGEFEVED